LSTKKPSVARIARPLLKLAVLRTRLVVGCWLAGTTPAAVQREFRLRTLTGTLPPGMVVAPRQPDDGDATVSAMLRKIVRVEGLRARCRWEEFRLRLAKARRRSRDVDKGAPRG
jgi:hypothetical protein